MGAVVILEFDETTHTYRLDGRVVPSVTQIIKPLIDYSHVPADALERARQEGTAIHRMVELDCAGDLDIDGLPDWLRPYLSAWHRFRSDTNFQIERSESRVYHPLMRYAGTLDLLGTGLFSRRTRRMLVDVKRSFAAGRAIGVQTAAYANCIDGPKVDRAGLQLRSDGTYRLRIFNDAAHLAVFLACLTLHNYKEAE